MAGNRIFVTPFVTVVTAAATYTANDALGAKAQFANVPSRGKIISILVADNAKQSVNMDIFFFNVDVVGTADQDELDFTDAELLTMQGVILVDTWKSLNDNSVGVERNTEMGYWAPAGTLFFQIATRGTPTQAAVDDISVALRIEH